VLQVHLQGVVVQDLPRFHCGQLGREGHLVLDGALEGVGHILGGKGPPVVEGHAPAQAEDVGGVVGLLPRLGQLGDDAHVLVQTHKAGKHRVPDKGAESYQLVPVGVEVVDVADDADPQRLGIRDAGAGQAKGQQDGQAEGRQHCFAHGFLPLSVWIPRLPCHPMRRVAGVGLFPSNGQRFTETGLLAVLSPAVAPSLPSAPTAVFFSMNEMLCHSSTSCR